MEKAPPGVGGQTNMGGERHGGGDGGEGSRPGTRKGDWIKAGVVSLTAPIRVFTQRHRIPVSTPSPPLPPPCEHGFAKRCPELCGTLTMAGMGSGTPKKSVFPFPAHPTLPRI